MKWILKRIARYLFTIGLVVHFSFALIYLIPGGPEDYIRQSLPPDAFQDDAAIEAMVEALLNIDPADSMHEQYINWMSSFLQGDLGESIIVNRGEPVTSILAEAVPWTVFLMLNSVIIAFSFGIVLGALMAYLEGSRFDSVATVVAIVTNSVPYYIFAVLLVFTFGYQTGWFPTGGRVGGGLEASVNLDYMLSVLYHAALPVLSWALFAIGGWALAMRGNSISVLGEDYMRVGRLRGLPTARLTTRYVARNAILPLYTTLMIAIGIAFGGSVILEQIFVYRGLGWYLYQGVFAGDYPLLMGGFIVVVCAVIAGVFFAELTYGKLDPRAQEGGAAHEAY